MENAQKLVQQFGKKKLAIVGGSGLAVLVAVGLLAAQAGGGDMAFLYTNLDPAAAQMVTEKLKGQGVEYQLSPDGTAVQVPSDKVAELRMSLANEQIGGKIGYEILDGEEPFGTSASRQKLNETRAIEGELAKSIKTMQRVRDARVHLVMPERELFAEEERPASAAITVKTTGRLSGEQTDAIRYLVSAAVPELSPDKISIVDQNGTLLARAGDGAMTGGAIDERRQSMEGRMREDVESMLSRIVGEGGVRAQVALDLDMDQVREESDRFDPDGQVIAKQTTVETSDDSSERSANGDVSVATQLPEGQGSNGSGDTNQRAAKETSEEVQYDNSKTHKTLVSSGGAVKRLTVSVMVDGTYKPGADGKPVYTPRSAAEIERLTRLVENAVGYNEARGDSVIVENMQFEAPADDEAQAGSFLDGFDPIAHLPSILLAIVAVVAMLLMWRQMKRRELPVLQAELVETPLLDTANVDPATLSPEMRELLARSANGDEEAMKEFTRLRAGSVPQIAHELDAAKANGLLKADIVKRVGEVIIEKPPEAAAVIRQWMAA